MVPVGARALNVPTQFRAGAVQIAPTFDYWQNVAFSSSVSKKNDVA